MTNTRFFKWNDILYKRVDDNGVISWYDMDYSTQREDVKLKHHRADIMESLFWKYPQNEVKE